MSKFHEIEAIYRQHIKELETKAKTLEDNDISSTYDIDSYVKRQELKSYISNYRLALNNLKEYGKGYIGHQTKDWWLSELDWLERTVFQMRFRQKKSFEEIKSLVKVTDVQKIYEVAYRKVIGTIQKNIGGM